MLHHSEKQFLDFAAVNLSYNQCKCLAANHEHCIT